MKNELRDLKKKNARAIFVTDEIYPKFLYALITHEAWNILKKELQGEEKVAMVKLQAFRREFENLNMKSEETIFLEFLILLKR